MASLVALAGCSEDPGIVVDLRTNLVAGVDFQEARLHVERVDVETGEIRTVRRPVNTSDGRDIRLGEVTPLPAGRYRVTVELWTSFETRIALNRVMVSVSELTAVTVLITADCAGVICPGSGDPPEATYCLGARCVPDTCREDPTLPECPEPECAADGDCTAVAACAAPRCEAGVCGVEPLDERCASGETCHIERGCLAVERPDGGATCTPGSCDDFNPCTDDVCGEMGCELTPNTSPCDDGVFCNGADTCGGGTCSSHTGSPCGDEMCNEGARTCAACLSDADCPADGTGSWSSCVFDDVCDETGTRTRDATSWACDAGACRPTTTPEMEDCGRDTDGTSCGMTMNGTWSACDYADGCDETATRSRSVTRYACAMGTCQSSMSPETEDCARDTDGMSCGTTTYGTWGACDYSDTCDESAMRSRSQTTFACAAGTCASTPGTDSEPCTRDTDGTMCAATSYGGWGSCDYSGTCDEDAMRSRDVTTHQCTTGTCTSRTDPELEPCSRSTTGTSCGATMFGTWGPCGYTDVCDQSATQSRSNTVFSCNSGSCAGFPMPEVQMCSRSTNGLDCDDGSYCNGEDTCSGGSCSHAGDPCTGGTVCDDGAGCCWDYYDDGTNCAAIAYCPTGTSLPSAPTGYSHFSPPAGCDYEGCPSMDFCQANYCMPCPGGDCMACPL